MAVQIQTRNGTAAQWTSANPTLMVGEIGAETDTGRFKIGNGSTAWNSLTYAASAKWQGAYSAGTAYVVNDVVSYNNSSYICILNSTGNLPTNTTYWSLMAAAGAGDVVGPASATNNVLAVYDGTTGKLLKNSTMVISNVGYIGAPQDAWSSGTVTLAAAQAGYHYYFSGSSTATLNIALNSAEAIPIGSTYLVVNDNSGNLSITGSAGVTIRLANGATGTRTVATRGLATLLKVGTDTWYVSGAGVT